MPRPVILVSEPWADLSLEELAQKASEWGYQGLEIGCVGDHLEVQRALDTSDYARGRLDLLTRYDLSAPVVATRVGQAIGDAIDERHRSLLPDYVWGDGLPAAVQQRAGEELIATVRAAQRLGVGIVAACSGSPVRPFAEVEASETAAAAAARLQETARRWTPVLDACRECGVRLALDVRPGQLAFDLYSAEATLDLLGGREEVGFAVAPCELHWQGVDPAEFVRHFPDRIFLVHLCDISVRLDGRCGLLNGYLPAGDPRRGWQYRSPGRGGVDWEGLVRALNAVDYAGPLAVRWQDPGMDRDFGAEDACRFIKRLDFEPSRRAQGSAFSD